MLREYRAWRVVMEAAGPRTDQKFRNYFERYSSNSNILPLSEKLALGEHDENYIFEQDISLER